MELQPQGRPRLSDATVSVVTNPNKKEKCVILSEASEYVAPAFGRNKQFRSESKDLRFVGTTTNFR
jgi:predicted Holliday junction resolvase-like endonuclease